MHSFILNCHKLQHSNIHHSGEKVLQRLFSAAFPTALSRMTERDSESRRSLSAIQAISNNTLRENESGGLETLPTPQFHHFATSTSLYSEPGLKACLTSSPKKTESIIQKWRMETVYNFYHHGSLPPCIPSFKAVLKSKPATLGHKF